MEPHVSTEGTVFGSLLIRGSKAWPSYRCMSFVHLAQARCSVLSGIFFDCVGLQDVVNHCLEVVLVSASASCCRLCVQHPSLPACWGLRFAIVSSVAVLFSLIFNPLACRVLRTSIVQILCLCRRTRIQQSSRLSLAPVKNDRSAIVVCRRCQLAATSLEVSRTLLLHLGSPNAGSFIAGLSGLAH